VSAEKEAGAGQEQDEARRRYEFKKTLEKLEAKEGMGTELITLYIPPDKQIHDVVGQLRDEFGQCANIKSKQTRTNVQSAISSILARLKYYKRPPPNGMAVLCGTVLLGGDRTDLECTIIEPPEPLNLYMYRCSSKFELDPLRSMLTEKQIQSSVRFARLRLIAINEFYKKVGERASAAFLAEKDFFERFKGVLIGGPTPTKEEFEAGGFLHHEIQKRVIGLFDVSYTNESGLSELVDAAQDALKGMDIVREKSIMTRFLQELVKENGNAAYGEESVRKNLEAGAVDTLLLSSRLRKVHVRIRCPNCTHRHEQTVQTEAGVKIHEIELGSCPACSTPLVIEDEVDIIEALTQLADRTGTKVEIISDNFEEGSMLFNAFGGIAAILRYRTGY
jgi:peptide chain release factor subunit 1